MEEEEEEAERVFKRAKLGGRLRVEEGGLALGATKEETALGLSSNQPTCCSNKVQYVCLQRVRGIAGV